MSQTDINAVNVQELSFAYAPGEPILDDISFVLPQGELMAVIGPNGGGKTTLLRLILGLLQPNKGQVRIFDRKAADASALTGYVPQFSTLQADFPASALDMTLMGAARPNWRGGSWPTDKKARQKALAYLEVLGLAECAKRPVGALSGGQRQRAMVARALMSAPTDLCDNSTDASEPFLLLLDEPTASIDPEGTFCFYEFLGKLRGRVSILVVSHDLFLVSPFFDSVLFVNKSLTPLSGLSLTPEALNGLFGSHMHDCPVADIQHAGGLTHKRGCTHPACRSNRPEQGEDCANCLSGKHLQNKMLREL
ncbi:ATP-binding cassette domain-containing protein [Desulfovibrio sp. OttesenSCG-928-M14]|nr:ATP-binding cassette domain-containing protein [Desulfovibrio sp. OttesenSCG-928-M14]